MLRSGLIALAVTVAVAGVGVYAAAASFGTSPDGTSVSPETIVLAGTTKATPVLQTRTTSLGKIVVGAKSRTVYVYGHDHKGTTKSACTGACKAVWPLVTFKGTAKTKIAVKGVTGKVGSIAASKGLRQVTLDGWPLYYYAGDGKAGDVLGQGSAGGWWVVAPSGTHLSKSRAKPSASSSPTSMPPTYNYGY